MTKPVVGRCEANVALFDAESGLLGETGGKFADRNQVYQQLFPLPRIEGLNVQIGTFAVGGRYAGASARVDASPIITVESDLLPLRIVEDAEILGQSSRRLSESGFILPASSLPPPLDKPHRPAHIRLRVRFPLARGVSPCRPCSNP